MAEETTPGIEEPVPKTRLKGHRKLIRLAVLSTSNYPGTLLAAGSNPAINSIIPNDNYVLSAIPALMHKIQSDKD